MIRKPRRPFMRAPSAKDQKSRPIRDRGVSVMLDRDCMSHSMSR